MARAAPRGENTGYGGRGAGVSKDLAVGAGFEVSVDKLRALGVVDPYCKTSLEVYRSGALTSDERLYFTLWGSKALESVVFMPKQQLATEGHRVHTAYFIVHGRTLGIHDGKVHRFGPGCVIGVAEAVAGLPHSMTFLAVDFIEARKIDASQIAKLVSQAPPGLRSIIRTITVRTLGIQTVPEVLE